MQSMWPAVLRQHPVLMARCAYAINFKDKTNKYLVFANMMPRKTVFTYDLKFLPVREKLHQKRVLLGIYTEVYVAMQ